MRQKLIILISFILFSDVAFGQHCAYDFASIIVVSIHEKDNMNNIPNFKISIVDRKGNPVLDHKEKEIVFWQNPKKSSTEYNNFENAREIKYPFAKDNYVWVCGDNFSTDDYYLKVEEINDACQYRLTDYKLMKLYEVDKFHLCDSYNNEDYHKNFGSKRLYKPIEIIVEKK